MFAIIDVETTGLSSRSEKITEIAIFRHNGKEVVDEFSTLINPEKKIPYRITQMTGISNKMVENAPRFCEVAKDIIEFTEDSTIVGHNVAFDYSFIRNEFKSLGYDFRREKLCTVKMSRKLLPLRSSYSLSKLCRDLNIQNPARHRAAGDAIATTQLFEFLLSIEPAITAISLTGLNCNLTKEKLKSLPGQTGVYYFYNEKNEIIYVGKSINIHERVLSHLSNNTSKKELELKNNIADVSYELTGSELIALLMESEEIKKHKPFYNRAQRRSVFTTGLFENKDKLGYLRLKIDKNRGKALPVTTFSNQVSAKEFLFRLVEEHTLCQKLCGLYKTDHACFHYHIRQCNGACIQKEGPEEYNSRVEEAIQPYKFDNSSFIVIDEGRHQDESSIVAVENGKYLGFGYLSNDCLCNDPEELKESINRYADNREVQQIIRNYRRRSRVRRVIEF